MDETIELKPKLLRKTYSFRVEPQSVDFQYRITMSSLVDILLTTAGFNADDNGFGLRKLHEAECAWVLSRLALEISQFPEQYQTIHVDTWVEVVGRASTTRNFCIRNDKNEIIGHACSNWVMLDMQTRRAKDLLTLEGIHDFASGEACPIEKPIKLVPVSGELFDTFQVKYSHIDINGHTNSARYIEWISNCFSLDQYREKPIKRFEINYASEVLFGDTVQVYGQEIVPDDYRFEIRNNDKISCRARVVF